jgi:hypothetical protein
MKKAYLYTDIEYNNTFCEDIFEMDLWIISGFVVMAVYMYVCSYKL